MTMIDVAALPASPWKNGTGSTRTLAVFPVGAGLDDFSWRISIADVAGSGDFSLFPGVDRTILLLDGAGMTLHTAGGDELPLTTPFEAQSFSGDEPIHSRLLNGPSRDFNVMTRRGLATAEVYVWRAKTSLQASPDAALFFCESGAWLIDDARPLQAGWAITAVNPASETQFTPQTPDAVMIAVLIHKPEQRIEES